MLAGLKTPRRSRACVVYGGEYCCAGLDESGVDSCLGDSPIIGKGINDSRDSEAKDVGESPAKCGNSTTTSGASSWSTGLLDLIMSRVV